MKPSLANYFRYYTMQELLVMQMNAMATSYKNNSTATSSGSHHGDDYDNNDDEEAVIAAETTRLMMNELTSIFGTVDNNSNHLEEQESATTTLNEAGFVSRHRKTLNRIASDSREHRRHPVPTTWFHSVNDRRNRAPSVESETHELSVDDNDDDDASDDDWQYNVWGQLCLPFRSKRNLDDWFSACMPAWKWIRKYDVRNTFPADLVAGITVGFMVIPQSMSYAKLAGLPVEYGLYSALIPVFAYALFGTSRQLAVGPVALISLLLSTGLTGLMDGNNTHSHDYMARYQQLAIQTSLLVGLINIVMGLCRLGFITIFLSHPVISGFTTGAAVIIGMSQIRYLFGYDTMGRSDRLHELLVMIFENIHQFKYLPFLMGVTSIAFLAIFKHVGKTYERFKWVRAAGPLVVTITAIALTVTFDWKQKGIPVVGSIPKGLPKVTISEWTPMSDFRDLMVVAISIVIVGFMESIAIAKQLASKHKYDIDASKELIGLGVANVFGAAFNAYPVTGSFSRSAINNETGARSGVSGMVTATLVSITLLFLTPIFEQLPLNTLAAIVISGVLGLLDYEEAMYLWKVHRFDFLVWLVACLCTMFLGVEMGLAVAVTVSMLIVIYESAYPQTSKLGRLPGTSHYRNIKQYPEAEEYDGIIIMRIDAPLYFANAQNVREKIRRYRQRAEAELASRDSGPCANVKYLILEMSPVSHIDSTALHQLAFMVDNYRSRGQELVFANPSLRVMQRLVASGLAQKIGDEFFFASLHDAVKWCLTNMDYEAVSTHGSALDLEKLKRNSSSMSLDMMLPESADSLLVRRIV